MNINERLQEIAKAKRTLKFYPVSDVKWLYNTVKHLQEWKEAKERMDSALNVHVKTQSKKVKHLFPLENTAGYGQLCDMVLKQQKRIEELEATAKRQVQETANYYENLIAEINMNNRIHLEEQVRHRMIIAGCGKKAPYMDLDD